MDILTIIGFIIGISAIYMVMVAGEVAHLLFNHHAAILVFGGTIGATMIAFPWKSLKHSPMAVKLLLFPPKHPPVEKLLQKLIRLTGDHMKRGPAALLEAEAQENDPFMKRSLNMLIEDIEKDLIVSSMKQEIISVQQRHQKTASVFRTMSTFAPIFGLLGTLIGVVQVLRNLTDPQSMGASMAIAVTTTFYGIFGANFLFLPAAIKLSEHSEEELMIKELMTETVISILNKEVPAVAARRLEAFVSNRLKEEAA